MRAQGGAATTHRDRRVTAAAALREQLARELPPGLIAHIDRVVALAGELAERHAADADLARLMAQAHDVARAVEPSQLLARAEALGLAIDPVDRVEPVLLHGPVGAVELYERLGVRDDRVLHAVHWHTSGHIEYGTEAWAMFIADKVEPHKVERWPALAGVRAAAEVSLEGAALAYLDLLLARAIEERWQLHPAAVLARNALIGRLSS